MRFNAFSGGYDRRPPLRPALNRSSEPTGATSPTGPPARLVGRVCQSDSSVNVATKACAAAPRQRRNAYLSTASGRRLIRQNNNLRVWEALHEHRVGGLSWVVRPRDRLPAGQADAHPRSPRRSSDLSAQRAAGRRHHRRSSSPRGRDFGSGDQPLAAALVSAFRAISRRCFWSPTSAKAGSTAITRAAAVFDFAPMGCGSEPRSAPSAPASRTRWSPTPAIGSSIAISISCLTRVSTNPGKPAGDRV